MNGSQVSFKDRWKDFTDESSMHGIRYTTQSKVSLARRIMWLVLILASLGYFGFAAEIFLSDFIKQKINTKVKVAKADELQFPTVTICNKNSWMYTAEIISMLELGMDEIMKDLYLMDRPSPPPLEKYNWSDPMYAPMTELSAKDAEEFLKRSAHPLHYSMFYCYFQAVNYSCSDLFKTVKTDAGYCYQFNGDGNYKVNSAGKSGGLRIGLNTAVDLYSIGPDSYSEGFLISFHDAHEVPLMTELSVGVSPGNEASIMLHKSETIRVPPPADDGQANCFNTESLANPLKYYKNYSFSACYVECKAKYVIDKCGCRDLLQPEVNGALPCSMPEMLYCSTPAIKGFPSDPQGLKACSCPDPCIEAEYTAKVSSFQFPSAAYARIREFSEADVEYAKKNIILVDIYFGKMSYQRLEEYVAYKWTDMVASLGGTIGVCVGASILTLCEFLEFLTIALLRKVKKLTSHKNNITPVKTFVRPQ